MTRIDVPALGLRREEPDGFAIDRPYGLGQFLFVRFHSPMEVLSVQGLANAEPGHCILFSPDFPNWYRGRTGDWVNDWMHLVGDELTTIAARHQVPLNTPMVPDETRFIQRIFEELLHELYEPTEGWEEAMDLLVRQLLLKMGRAIREPSSHLTPTESAYLPAFRELRRRVQEQLTRRWSIAEMAKEIGLSPSRFAALYQKFFGISPLEDLLRARLQFAENLLTNRAMSVGEAAAQSGFRSIHYFSRLFHDRIGCAPSDYHRIRLEKNLATITQE